MDFGEELLRNQVPEWASSYIDYRNLERLVETLVVASTKDGKDVDLAEFRFTLDRNLEEVDGFFNKKLARVRRHVKALHDRNGQAPEVATNLDNDEAEALLGIFLELRSQLKKLQWFGEVNRRGFVKITKKLDRRLPYQTAQHKYVSTKVELCPFAQASTTSEPLSEVNRWIARLGGPPDRDEVTPENLARPLGLAQAMPAVSAELVDKLENSIRQDETSGLEILLLKSNLIGKKQSKNAQSVLLTILQMAISARSRRVMGLLLIYVWSLDEPHDINRRNCIHRLVIQIQQNTPGASIQKGTEMALSPNPSPMQQYARHLVTPATSHVPEPRQGDAAEQDDFSSDEDVQLLVFLLEKLQPEQRGAISSRDVHGRLPLHYAAHSGLYLVCQLLMKKMQEWGQFNVDGGIDAPEWQDKEGHAPVHLSVLGGHLLTTMALLRGQDWHGVNNNKSKTRRSLSKSSTLLTVATRANHPHIVQMLVDAGVNINWSDKTGEAALHVAAGFGHAKCAEVLIKGAHDQKAKLDMAQKSYAWTPLHIAAVHGHLAVAKLLVGGGADVDRLDADGWTATEHASLRGHLDIARLLASHSRSTPDTPSSSKVSSSTNRRSNVLSQQFAPIKTFGHRNLKNESMVVVSLGSMDMGRNAKALTLEKASITTAHAILLDTALSVVVSAQGAHGAPSHIDLPVHETISADPIVFMTTDATKVKLLVDVVPTYSGNTKKIGRGAALLSSIRPTIGNKGMNLQGGMSVPILSSELDVIGVVSFNFLVITPFHHPNMKVNSHQTYWKKTTGPMATGHRGLGKDLASSKSLQLGENFVPSFITAANLGAQYVKFDVQLTKEHVPVVYHGVSVSETDFDAPVHTLNVDCCPNPDASLSPQHVNTNLPSPPASTYLSSPPPSPNPDRTRDSRAKPRQRSMAMHQSSAPPNPVNERMKHTRDFKANYVAPFTTLDELFRKVPETVGFNVEVNYPTPLSSSKEHDLDVNSFCDAILTKVYDHLTTAAGSRRVLLSSAHPDVCLCLSFKQPSIPVLLRTQEATSLHEAIRFARRWKLLGIVGAAEPFVISPRLVGVVGGSGLVCGSWGRENGKRELVERQVREGIDAVVVDGVMEVRKGLAQQEEEEMGGLRKGEGLVDGLESEDEDDEDEESEDEDEDEDEEEYGEKEEKLAEEENNVSEFVVKKEEKDEQEDGKWSRRLRSRR